MNRPTLPVAITFFAVLLCCYFAYRYRRSSQPSDQLVLQDDRGRELTMDDLDGFTGTVNWKIVGGDHVSPRAQELHDLGRQAGGSGDYQRALALFAQSRKEAPDWPYPVYDAAYTYLLQGDIKRAAHQYEEVARLAPRGFFTYMPELDCVRREQAGEFPAGTCQRYISIVDWPDSLRKREALQELLDSAPSLAPAWGSMALALDDKSAKLQALERGLACNPDPQTRGTMLINRALLLRLRGDSAEAVRILQPLAEDPNSPLNVELTAKVALAQILKKRSLH